MKSFKTIVESNFKKNREEDESSIQHLHSSLRDHYHTFESHHLGEIHDYTLGSYGVNSYQWDKHVGYQNTPSYSMLYDEKTKQLDAALNHYKTPHKLTLYSGMKLDPRKRMDNGVLYHPAYLSTSLSKSIGKKFGYIGPNTEGASVHHVLNIKVPKGHPGAYVEHVSLNKREHEFILPRGLKLKHIKTDVHNFDEGREDYPDKRQVLEHHMEIVK